LFLITVLSFVFGLYIEAIKGFSLFYIALFLSIGAITLALIIHKGRLITIPIIISCFILAGALRMGLVVKAGDETIPDGSKEVMEAVVIESSKAIKALKLITPQHLKGLMAVIRTDKAIKEGSTVVLIGELRSLAPTFKNPFITGWRQIKRLEGITYEIKGDVFIKDERSSVIEWLRAILRKRVGDSNATHQAIIKALTIGDRLDIDDATNRLFLETGTSHILSVSGTHLGIIAGLFFFLIRLTLRRSYLLRLRGDDKRYAALMTIPFTFIYMLLTGAAIPTIRATIMVTLYLLAILFERERHPLNILALSALIILLIYPHSIFVPSFQLTFMSVLFLIIVGERFYPFVKIKCRLIKWTISSITMTLSAVVGTLPIVVYHFYGISPLSFIHNLIAVPLLCMIAMPVALIGMVIPYGEHLLRFAGMLIGLNLDIMERLNLWYIYPVIRPDLIEVMLYYQFVLGLIYLSIRSVRIALIGLLIPAIVVTIIAEYNKRFNNSLCINMIDVGMGESILIEAPLGLRLLIDGGSNYSGTYDVGERVITPILLSKKVLTIDYLINTHPHSDHIGGLSYILKHFKVKHLVTARLYLQEHDFVKLFAAARARHIDIVQWKRGDEMGYPGGLQIKVLNPEADRLFEDMNNNSIALMLRYKDNSFLFTGDIGSDVERELILSRLPLKANLLKVPHHGSNNSSSMAFLLTVRPDIAIMSVGKGLKGLPGEKAMERYKRLSIPIYSTLTDGFIRVCSDGERLYMKDK
jgi:competence protein ComEC